MLVLSRKANEEIMMKLPDGRVIRLQVIEIAEGKVRLGIAAPKDVPVHRREIWEQIQAENKDALTGDMETA